MKNVLLIGAGRFGRHIAMQLSQLGHQVMAVDTNEERINDVLPFVTNAQIGDSTNAEFLRCSLWEGKILPRLRGQSPSQTKGGIRPETAVGCRQFGGEKPLNGKPSRTAKAARQYDFPRSREIEFYLST